MPDKRLLILTAVPLEGKAIALALGMKTPRPGKSVTGGPDGTSLELGLVGIRAHGLEPLRVSTKPTHVLMAGLAGALEPALQVGDVVIDGSCDGLIASSPYRRGRICCSDRIVATPAEKAALFGRTRALAVEMENDRVRAWAEAQGATFIAVRAISDRADQSLDPAVLGMVDEWGQPKLLAIASILARRPRLIPQLTRLGRDSKLAAERLARSIKEMVAILS